MPNFPNRCQHLKVNGTQCGSPALRRNRFCYFHKLHHEERVELNLDRLKNARRRRATIDLPVLEDANSIQVSLMQIMRLIIAGQIDAKTAGLLLYALQTASFNLPRTTLAPSVHDVVLDPKTVNQTPLSAHIWEDSDFESAEQEEEEEDDDEAPHPADQRKTAANAPQPRKRPPANVSMDEVRKKITDQVRKALPAIAAAQSARERSHRENGNSGG